MMNESDLTDSEAILQAERAQLLWESREPSAWQLSRSNLESAYRHKVIECESLKEELTKLREEFNNLKDRFSELNE